MSIQPALKALMDRLVEELIEIPGWVDALEIDDEGYPWAYDSGGHYKGGLPGSVKRICKELFVLEGHDLLIEKDQLEILRNAVREAAPPKPPVVEKENSK